MTRGLFLTAIAVLALGCGGDDNDAIQVKGVVLNADGSPVKCESGMVLFVPAGSGEHATGGVETDGSFTMMTKVQGDGVKPGKYKVVLQLWKSYRDQVLAVPKKYGDAETTPLEATVDSDHDEALEFKVEPDA